MKMLQKLFKATLLTLLLLLFVQQTPCKAQYSVNNLFGNYTDCDTMTRGIFIVWWDKDFNYTAQVSELLDTMLRFRNTCLNDLLMADPPNPEDGYYYNVYIHTPGNAADFFGSYNWGNGQGTDGNGYPFLTLPYFTLTDVSNTAHETFHVFQYNANSPGYAYTGDSQWYIEGSANWFAGIETLNEPRAFVEAESLVRLPHVPLWLSYNNFPAAYPQNWQRYVHQYASALLLYYLTDVAGVPDTMITTGFFSGTTEKPQEYLFNRIGGSTFRNHFIDWAAHMTNDFDFITPTQRITNLNEWNWYADPADDNEYSQVYTNSGSGGWYRPHDTLITNAWSFNTYKLRNSQSETYTFEIGGDWTGTFGDSTYFQGKVVVQNSISGTSFHDLNMVNNYEGSLSLSLTASDTAAYFIIASMPEYFADNNGSFQRFGYNMRISTGVTANSALEDLEKPKKEVARYNILGQPVRREMGGLQIILYNDRTTEKVYVDTQY